MFATVQDWNKVIYRLSCYRLSFEQLTWRRSSSVYFMLKRDGASEGQGSATDIYKGDLHVRGQIPAYKGWPTREGSGTYPHCTGLTYRTTIGRGHSPKLSRISTSCNCTHIKYIGCRVSNFRNKIISRKSTQEETDGHFVKSSPLSWIGKDAEFRFVLCKTVDILVRETKANIEGWEWDTFIFYTTV